MQHPSYPITAAAIRQRQQYALDPCAAGAVDAIENQQRITSWPYFSTVKFKAIRSGASGSFVYTMATQTRGLRAFGYALGETKEAAGYAAIDGQATAADTNIITKNQTISGQFVEIKGMAFQWHTCGLNAPSAGLQTLRYLDGNFVSALHRVISCEMGVNGDEQTYKLGTIGMIPGAGGLRGGASLLSGLGALDANQDTQFAANGWETRSNFFRVPEGVLWTTSDKPDGNLNVIFRQQEPLVLPAGGSPENNALATTAAPIASVSRGYNYPTELVAELKVFLIGQVIGGRTRTA